jgi:membrane associated rhomboid family serine protease
MSSILAAPAATLILAAFAIISLLALNKHPEWMARGVFRPHWLLPRQQWGTVVSHAFLHGDLAHLLFNGFSFWAFAFSLEPQMGTERFVGLYIVGLLASTLGTWVQHHKDPHYQCLGASGAILAVLFASIILNPTAKLFIMPIPVPIPAPLFALGYLGYTIYAARQAQGRVNHDAHLWGALSGLLYVVFLFPGALMHAFRVWLP